MGKRFALASLRAALGERCPATVLLDASPDLPFEDVLRIFDAILGSAIEAVAFAGPGEAPIPAGVRVLPAAERPGALERVIGLQRPR